MKQDKAIRKVLLAQKSPVLSSDFNVKMITRIYLEAAKIKKREYIRSMFILSITSVGLISMAIYSLRDYIVFKFTIAAFQIRPESVTLVVFSCYIAFLVLVLIGLDNYFRNVRHKKILKNPALH